MALWVGMLLADINHGAPLGELGAELGIFFNAGCEAIEAFGHGFAGRERQGLPRIKLDAGNGAGALMMSTSGFCLLVKNIRA